MTLKLRNLAITALFCVQMGHKGLASAVPGNWQIFTGALAVLHSAHTGWQWLFAPHLLRVCPQFSVALLILSRAWSSSICHRPWPCTWSASALRDPLAHTSWATPCHSHRNLISGKSWQKVSAKQMTMKRWDTPVHKGKIFFSSLLHFHKNLRDHTNTCLSSKYLS